MLCILLVGNERQTWNEARLAREQGIDVISVGVGQSIRLRELQGIASYPNNLNQNLLRVENFNALGSIRDTIIRAACGSKL